MQILLSVVISGERKMLGVPLQRVIAIVSPCRRHLRWIRDRPQGKPGNVDE
jgi:hypothetical protein